MDCRAFFDKLAPTWDNHEYLSTPDRVRAILNHIGLRRSMSVLDLGTGTGILIPYVAELIGSEGHLTAVDFSKEMLSRAVKKYSGIQPPPVFLLSDFETQSIPGVYDHILLYCVYPHISRPVDTIRHLIDNNLAPDGTITIAFPCEAKVINEIHRRRNASGTPLPEPAELASMLRQNSINASVALSTPTAYIVNITG